MVCSNCKDKTGTFPLDVRLFGTLIDIAIDFL